MSDVEEPPPKITKYQLESQYLEGEVMEEGQEEWLSEGILTDDDYPADDQDQEQERSDSNLGNTSQDENCSTLHSANNSMDRLEDTDSQEQTLDQTNQAIDQTNQAIEQTDQAIEQTDQAIEQTDQAIAQTDQAISNDQVQENSGLVESQIMSQEYLEESTDCEDQEVDEVKQGEAKNIEETLNNFEKSKNIDVIEELPGDLNTFLIRKTDGKVVENEKISDNVEESKHSEDDGNDTDDLLRMLGEGEQKKKKALKALTKDKQDDTSDDEYMFEMRTLKMAKNTLIRKHPAKRAEPEEDDTSTDDEAPVQTMRLRRREPVKRSIVSDKNGSTLAKNSLTLAKNSLTITKNKSNAAKNSPTVVKHSPAVVKKSSTVAKKSLTVPKNSPTVVKNSSTIAKNSPVVAKNSPVVVKNISTVAKNNVTVTVKQSAKNSSASTKSSSTPAKNSTNSTKNSSNLDKSNSNVIKFESSAGRLLIKQLPLLKQPGEQVVDVRRLAAAKPAQSTPLKQHGGQLLRNHSLLKPATSKFDELLDEKHFLEDNDFDLNEDFAETDTEPSKLQKQRIMRPEQMDEEVPTDADSYSDDDSIYDELPSSDSDNADDWFTLDIRAERAGDYLPLLGERAYQLLLDEKRRVTARLATLKKSLSSLTDSGRQQADQLRKATSTVAELDAMLKAT